MTTAKSIHAYKTCIKCRAKYRVSDAFSKSVCPKCDTTNREILSWTAYIMDYNMAHYPQKLKWA